MLFGHQQGGADIPVCDSSVDWRQFRLDIEALFNELGISQARYYIKADLRKA
jgi:hypothetical protein